MSDNSVEQQIRELMEGLEFRPDAAVWDKVRAEIAPPEKRRRLIAWWFPVLLLLVLGGVIFVLFNRSGKQPLAGQQEVTVFSAPAPAAGDTTTTAATGIGTGNKPVTGQPFNEEDGTVAGATEVEITTSPITGDIIDHKNRQAIQARVKTTIRAAIAATSGAQTVQSHTAMVNRPILLSGVTDEPDTDSVQHFLLLPDPAIIQQEQLPVSRDSLTAISDPKVPFLPVLSAPLPPVIKRKETGKWQTLFFVNTGINAVKGADNMSVADEQQRQIIEQQNKSLNFSSVVTPGNAGNSFLTSSTMVYTRSRSSSGIAFGAGILAGKKWFGKLELQSGLRYQYAAYTINTSYFTDSFARSAQTGQFANIPTVNHTEVYHYRFHYLGIPVLLHYNLAAPLGITAGVMNDFVVMAKQNSQSIRPEMHVWNPSAYFSFAVKIPGAGRYQWQVMPYVQYGLSTVFKNIGEQRLWQPGVQILLRFPH